MSAGRVCRAVTLAVLLSGSGVFAQDRTMPYVDLSGFWMLRFDPAVDTIQPSGNAYAGYVPPAPLTPEARKLVAASTQPELLRTTIPTETVVSLRSRWCQAHGYPFFMRSPEAIDIIQGDRQIMITGDRPMGMRHIYLDQQTHPAGWEPTLMGHAIGRWEGDTLITHTVGLTGSTIPGALATTPDTRLTERYRLLSNDRLSVTFTWEDPTQLTAPHTHELIYYRQPVGTFAYENFCDASDPRQYSEPIAPITPK